MADRLPTLRFTSTPQRRLIARRLPDFAAVIARALVRIARAWPDAVERLHLEWALREIDPMHEDVHMIVHRLNELRRVS